jgi:hypothetical protein
LAKPDHWFIELQILMLMAGELQIAFGFPFGRRFSIPFGQRPLVRLNEVWLNEILHSSLNQQPEL